MPGDTDIGFASIAGLNNLDNLNPNRWSGWGSTTSLMRSAMWSDRTTWIIAALIVAIISVSTLMLVWEHADITSMPSELAGEPVHGPNQTSHWSGGHHDTPK
jgi:hypothetical protein